jgi:hypothetical protein
MIDLRNIVSVTALFFSLSVSANTWYVASNGSDTGQGTIQDPFLTIGKAVIMVQAGETIYIRGGTYTLTSTIILAKNGSNDSAISLFAFPGEKPILDFAGQALDPSNRGILLTGNYWHIKGISITRAGDNGMKIEGGSYNIIENCNFYRNRDSGLQLDNGASYNSVLNCDSYYNADPPDFGDADGFAPKLTVGNGNYFYGCRAWNNCDDGWDGYLRGADDISTTLENCWSFENGYLEDGTDPGANANGNGFKMGGSDDKTLRHNFTLLKCLAFKNKAKGFDQNNNKGTMILYNCTGHNNVVADYRITQDLATGKVLIVKNCIDLGKIAELGSFAEQEKNSWMPPFVITPEDFISTSDIPVYGNRNENGDLPDIDYMHLAPGSDLIDAGVDVGLSYAGILPDLGCFESIYTGMHDVSYSTGILCSPNPIKEKGLLHFNLQSSGRCEILLIDISGRYIKTLADQIAMAGEQTIIIDMSDVKNATYIYQVRLNNIPVFASRLVKGN